MATHQPCAACSNVIQTCIDSSGSATYVAATAELRSVLFAAGGTLDTYDLMWLDENDEVLRRVTADPSSANAGCGGVLAAACTQGKRETLVRLLAAGARVPPVLTECRSYLLSDPAMLRLLLESGMNPDLPNWLLMTPLHDLCGRDGRGRLVFSCAAVVLGVFSEFDRADCDQAREQVLFVRADLFRGVRSGVHGDFSEY